MKERATSIDPASVLRRVLVERVARNPSYSLRAFARNLGVSHAYLSMLLNGKRRIPVHQALRFSQLAGLSETESKSLVASCREAALERFESAGARTTPRTARPTLEYYRLQLDDFRMLSEWYHVAILDLTQLENFRSEPRWIAERLGLKTSEVGAAVRRLVRLGMLDVSAEPWKKSHSHVEVFPLRSEEAVRRFHLQMLEKAKESMSCQSQEAFEAREIGGTTTAVNPARLQEAKRRIRKFRRSLMGYVTQGHCTELYQLNVQFFPLTRKAGQRKQP